MCGRVSVLPTLCLTPPLPSPITLSMDAHKGRKSGHWLTRYPTWRPCSLASPDMPSVNAKPSQVSQKVCSSLLCLLTDTDNHSSKADVDGWNALFASLSESTSYPSYPDTLPLETLTYCAANPQPFSINDHNHYPYFGPVPLTEDQLISNLNSSTVLSFPDLLDNTEHGMYGDYHYHWGQFGLGCWTEDAGAMGISAHDL